MRRKWLGGERADQLTSRITFTSVCSPPKQSSLSASSMSGGYVHPCICGVTAGLRSGKPTRSSPKSTKQSLTPSSVPIAWLPSSTSSALPLGSGWQSTDVGPGSPRTAPSSSICSDALPSGPAVPSGRPVPSARSVPADGQRTALVLGDHR